MSEDRQVVRILLDNGGQMKELIRTEEFVLLYRNGDGIMVNADCSGTFLADVIKGELLHKTLIANIKK